MKTDLVTDYLNKNSDIIDEKVVVKNCVDNGNYVTVLVEWECGESLNSTHLDISLFDLMKFIYSKS